MSDIRREFNTLVEEGVREMILVAQDTTNYGADLDAPTSLAELLRDLNEQDYDGWIRVMYMYPSRVTSWLIETMARSEAIVPYFDIPFQHASPELLRRMGRPIDGQPHLEKLAQIRQMIPEAAFRTSLIVGLPGETEQDFELLCDFVREARFDRLGVFPYWPELETRAAQMDDQVPPEVARQRQEALIALQEEISLENNQRFVGQRMRVLVEREVEEGLWAGRSYRDAPEIDGEVLLQAGAEGIQPRLGEFVWATVTQAQVHDLEVVVGR
jgi:ribosomal protein S12 methylthiotransferase